MSKTYYRIRIVSDTGLPDLEETIIFRVCNNSTDTERYFTHRGETLELQGSDSFMQYLSSAMQTYENFESFNTIGEGFQVEIIPWKDLPEIVKDGICG